MTFSILTDPLLGEMTLCALSNPASVDRDRLLKLIVMARLRGSAVWDEVVVQPAGWMQVEATVVNALIKRASVGDGDI